MTTAVINNAFTSASNGGAIGIHGGFNLAVYGTFVGTVVLEKSFDDGTTWLPVSKDSTGAAMSFTSAACLSGYEYESGVTYRFRCSAYTSGTINTRISS